MKHASRIIVLIAVIVCMAVVVGSAAGQAPAEPDQIHIDQLIPRQPAAKSSHMTISPDAQIDRVILKLAEGTRSRLSEDKIISLTGKNLGEVNRAIRESGAGPIKRLALKPPDKVEREKSLLESACWHQLADMNTYFALPVTSPAQAEQLVHRLNQMPEVEIAYPEPRATFADDIYPPTPRYDSTQTYLRPAPTGVDADYARTIPGGDGSGVRVVDVEGGWRFDHEDLETAVDGLIGGEPIDNIDWRNHGTAVIGVMIGGDNGYGVTGIVPNADIGMVSVGGIGNTEAFLLAVDSLQAGDIMTIELHAAGPRYNFQARIDQLGYVCMEYWPANFDAFQLAWAKGIIVCEAAGNGAENLDDPIYENRFDTTYRNSHALLCGAGAPPSGNFGSDRSRLSFSNYGERVNLQGHGREVVTTGYGYLFSGAGDERQYYTGDFGGTSSATPVIAGAAAALQGIYKAQYAGAVLGSDRMRDIFIATGSPQQGNTYYEHIGPRPNLRAADSALTAPPDLAIDPVYFDTTLDMGAQMSVFFDLANRATDKTLEYSIATLDSISKNRIGNWITIPFPTGTISPLGTESIEVILDASFLEDRTAVYKGMIEIAYGEAGGPLDLAAVVPVFMIVPCADTTYAVSASSDPGGPAFEWIDITSTGSKIEPYLWYNPFVTERIIDDGTSGPFSIGFDFPFYGAMFQSVFIGANGGFSFTDTNVNVIGFYDQVSIPNPPFATFVSPFWNDFNLDPADGGHGDVYYFRSSPRDTLIIEFYHVGNFNDPNDTLTTFEVIFTKNGNIAFQYLSVGNFGLADSATVGIAQYDCASAPYVVQGDPSGHVVSDGTAILFDYAYTVWEMAGDANSDGAVNLADAVFLINWIFKGGPTPKRMMEAEANCDEMTNLADAVYLINYVFKSGPPPCLYAL